MISFSLSLTGDRHFLITIYCHLPGGDTAAALADIAYYTSCAHSPQSECDNATVLAAFTLSECFVQVITLGIVNSLL